MSQQVQREERWTSTDNWAFWSFGLGFLLENYVFSLTSIATGWVKNIPPSLTSLLLAWSPLWLIIGIAVTGPLADRLGRKNAFYSTMTLYAIGAIGLVFSSNYALILLFLAIMLFAAGGEMNTIMAASHEMMPTKHRSKTMFLELNFINLGGFLLAVVSLLSAYQSISFQRGTVAIAFLIVLIVLLLARSRTPESIPWLKHKGLEERAQQQIAKYYDADEYAAREAAMTSVAAHQGKQGAVHSSTGLKLFATITTAFAGAAGFGLMTYVLGPHFFPKLTASILLVATGTGFFSGFFGFWADRWSRKNLLMVGYLGTVVITGIIFLTIPEWSKSPTLFWALLILLNLFVNIGYLTEDALKGEIWPTKSRASYTALVRFVSIGLYIVTIYLTQSLSLSSSILFNLVVWIIGLVGAGAWYIWGHETGKGVSLDVASGEASQ